MLTNPITIRYDGFYPSAYTKNKIEDTMHEILNEAPTGGTLQATFTKNNEIVKGLVQVSSSAGPFFAIVTDTDLQEVCRKLLMNIRRRLDKWKAKRHFPQNINDKFTNLKQV